MNFLKINSKCVHLFNDSHISIKMMYAKMCMVNGSIGGLFSSKNIVGSSYVNGLGEMCATMCVSRKGPLYDVKFWYQLLLTTVRGSLHYAAQVERLLPKLLSRGEGRSPFKYIMSVCLLNFEYFIEKNFHLSTRVWISILGGSKLLSRGQTLGAKSVKKNATM